VLMSRVRVVRVVPIYIMLCVGHGRSLLCWGVRLVPFTEAGAHLHRNTKAIGTLKIRGSPIRLSPTGNTITPSEATGHCVVATRIGQALAASHAF